MRGTASTRTATRWPSCRAPRAVPRAAALLLLAIVAACVVSRAVSFQGVPGGARVGLDEARAQLNAVMPDECARLLREKKRAAGEARFDVAVDSTGAVTVAQLAQPAGDTRIEGIFGTMIAGLRLAPPRARAGESAERRMRAGYACSGWSGTATLELL